MCCPKCKCGCQYVILLTLERKKKSWMQGSWIFFLLKNKCGHRNVLSKRQVWMSIFHIINFKKKKFMDTVLPPGFFFNKKLILDYYFCLKSGPVFLFQIFIIAPLGYKIVSLIIN
jgi:hypothetical protein